MNKFFALSFIVTGAVSLSANFAEAACPHNQSQHKSEAEKRSCREAHGGQKELVVCSGNNPDGSVRPGCAEQVVEVPKCGAGSGAQKAGCGSVPVNNRGQIEADIVLSEKDMAKLREKQGEIEAKRLKKVAEADRELSEDLAKRRRDADKYYQKSEEINARIAKLEAECRDAVSPCREDLKKARKLAKELRELDEKAEKHNAKAGRRGDHQYEIYERYYTQKHQEKIAKINREAEEDQVEALEKAGKPGFWARLGGGFKAAGKGVFVKTPRFIFERGKDVVWDGPKHVIKSIGGKLFRCGCEDGKTVTDCREVEVTRAVTRNQSDVSDSTTVGQIPSIPRSGGCSAFDVSGCAEFGGLPSAPESSTVSLTAVEDIPAEEVATAPAAAESSTGYLNYNPAIFKNIRFDAGSGQ